MNRNSEALKLAVPVNKTDHIVGPETAKVVLVQYGDFECPTCGQAYPAVKMLLKKFEHRLRFVFRHFPLTAAHPNAELAAEAAEAAGVQHKFWPMHDLLFQNQSHLKPKDLHHYAEQLELDLVRFDFELSDQVYRQRVNEHVESGKHSGVRSMPAFFVNGSLVDVSFGLDRLHDAVHAKLKA
ncbi:MAG: thioredoxin domain-containing protein [Betaproteobacteria bacterium]|nr:thioredoxin domain-containing protein [Betaproteobacteria bacterium]